MRVIADFLAGVFKRAPARFIFLTLLIALYVTNALPILREWGHIRTFGQPHTHIRLAQEFLQGSMEFDELFYKDIAIFQGHYFSPFPPFPALALMLPVALFGVNWPITLITPLLGAGIGVILYRVLVRMDVQPAVSAWCAYGFVLGTVHWFTLRSSIDTCLANVLAVGLVFLAMEFAVHRRAPLWIGVFMGCAFLSRQLAILSLPFVWALMRDSDGDQRFRRMLRPLLWTVPGLALALGLYLLYNHLRFGNPMECGYPYIAEPSWYGTRMERWGIHHWIYIPSNLLQLFVQGFVIEFNDPNRLIPDMGQSGTSLTFASPFLFFALAGRFSRRPLLNWTGGIGIGLCLMVLLMNKNAMGGWQINGMRYALDFLPTLMIFAARGMQRHADGPYHIVWKSAIVYSILLNALAFSIQYIPKMFG
ncbi:MAG: hypothetical protein KBA51_00855 [Kiritimatiellae bacterium]|nr:hypothetical protein [Kiritimatiellia bacterium]